MPKVRCCDCRHARDHRAPNETEPHVECAKGLLMGGMRIPSEVKHPRTPDTKIPHRMLTARRLCAVFDSMD